MRPRLRCLRGSRGWCCPAMPTLGHVLMLCNIGSTSFRQLAMSEPRPLLLPQSGPKRSVFQSLRSRSSFESLVHPLRDPPGLRVYTELSTAPVQASPHGSPTSGMSCGVPSSSLPCRAGAMCHASLSSSRLSAFFRFDAGSTSSTSGELPQ